VFRHYISGTHVVPFSDIVKNFATATQRLAPLCSDPAPQDSADPTEEPAVKIADPVYSLKVERGRGDGNGPRRN